MRSLEPHPGLLYTVSQSSKSEADGRMYIMTAEDLNTGVHKDMRG